MADLSSLNPLAPFSTQDVKEGPAKIRETRDAIVTSFGGSDIGSGTQAAEHFLKGFHRFPYGNDAGRPTANPGQLYFNTEQDWIENNSEQLHAVGNSIGTITRIVGDIVSLPGGAVWSTYKTLSFSVLADSDAFLIYSAVFFGGSGGGFPLFTQVVVDSLTMYDSTRLITVVPINTTMRTEYMTRVTDFSGAPLAAGPHTLALQALTNSTTNTVEGLMAMILVV